MFALLTASIAMAIQGTLGFMGVNPILRAATANITNPEGVTTTVTILQGLHIPHMVTNGLVGLALGLVIAQGTVSLLQPVQDRVLSRVRSRLRVREESQAAPVELRGTG